MNAHDEKPQTMRRKITLSTIQETYKRRAESGKSLTSLELAHKQEIEAELAELTGHKTSPNSALAKRIKAQTVELKAQIARATGLPHKDLVKLQTTLQGLQTLGVKEHNRLSLLAAQWESVAPYCLGDPLYTIMKRGVNDGFSVALYRTANAWRDLVEGRGVKPVSMETELRPRSNYDRAAKLPGWVRRDEYKSYTFKPKDPKPAAHNKDDYAYVRMVDQDKKRRACVQAFEAACEECGMDESVIDSAIAIILRGHTLDCEIKTLKGRNETRREKLKSAIMVGLSGVQYLFE